MSSQKSKAEASAEKVTASDDSTPHKHSQTDPILLLPENGVESVEETASVDSEENLENIPSKENNGKKSAKESKNEVSASNVTPAVNSHALPNTGPKKIVPEKFAIPVENREMNLQKVGKKEEKPKNGPGEGNICKVTSGSSTNLCRVVSIVPAPQEPATLDIVSKEAEISSLQKTNTKLLENLEVMLKDANIPAAASIERRMEIYKDVQSRLRLEPRPDSRLVQTAAYAPNEDGEPDRFPIHRFTAWQVVKGDDGNLNLQFRFPWADGEEHENKVDGSIEYLSDFIASSGNYDFAMAVGRLGIPPYKQYLHFQPASLLPGQAKTAHSPFPSELKLTKKTWICVLCLTTCPSRSKLMGHLKTEPHKNSRVREFPKCNCCGEQFSTLSALDKHVDSRVCYIDDGKHDLPERAPSPDEAQVLAQKDKIKEKLFEVFRKFEGLLDANPDALPREIVEHARLVMVQEKLDAIPSPAEGDNCLAVAVIPPGSATEQSFKAAAGTSKKNSTKRKPQPPVTTKQASPGTSQTVGKKQTTGKRQTQTNAAAEAPDEPDTQTRTSYSRSAKEVPKKKTIRYE